MWIIIILLIATIVFGCSYGYDENWGMDKYNNDVWTKDWFD